MAEDTSRHTQPAQEGHGRVTGCDLADLACLRQPFRQGPFFRMSPPLSHEAMTLSLELAALP